MKLLALFVALLSVILSVYAEEDCPAVYVKGEEHYSPDASCFSYWQCVDGGNKVKMSCGDLMWSPTANNCDREEVAGCTGDKTPVTPAPVPPPA